MAWSKPLAAQGGPLQLDLSALREGTYVLRLRLQGCAVRRGRFVIAK